jgi:hypothetical protein
MMQSPNDPRTPKRVLKAHKKEKKKRYLKACLEQHWHFSPFAASTDGLLGKESRTLLKKLSALLAEKWEKAYSEICGVRGRIAIHWQELQSAHFEKLQLRQTGQKS